jgi:hypothetical protein
VDGDGGKAFSFRPGDIVKAGKLVVYNPQRNTLRLVTGKEIFRDELAEDRYAYYIIAPITRAGIAFLGDAGKIAATGKKRIEGIVDAEKTLKVTVLFAKGESGVTLRGYSDHAVRAGRGKIDWDASTHLFTLSLAAPLEGNSVTVNFR